MKDVFQFPLTKTKMGGQRFNLEDRDERRRYFDFKVGKELEVIKGYLSKGTFMGFLLGPKNSGKGTYSKLFVEALNADLVAHLSVGDIVRGVSKTLGDETRRKELEQFLSKRYRGFLPLDKIFDVITGRDISTLLPTEVILALVEREIMKLNRKAVFIDGFPRNLDQVQLALYFRTLMGYRDDPDFLVFLDVPETIIAERMKDRVICPRCQVPRSLKLLRTKQVGYDPDQRTFYLVCDDPKCQGARMVRKEGDNLGIEALRDRLETDKKVMDQLRGLQGVPKVFVRNSIPAASASEYIDEYEITPVSEYEWDEQKKEVRIIEKPWTIPDDGGEPSYSLLSPAVVVSFIKQVADILESA